MAGTFLTAPELVELTGFRARHCQARWLERNRWRFVLNRRGEPRVARDHFNERMGCSGRASRHASANVHPTGLMAPSIPRSPRLQKKDLGP